MSILKHDINPFNLLLGKQQTSISTLYHENSKFAPVGDGLSIMPLELSKKDLQLTAHACKTYQGAKTISFVSNVCEPQVTNIFSLLKSRRSSKKLNGIVGYDEISYLLKTSTGITSSIEVGAGVNLPRRAYPSAGGLYPIEIYFFSHKVENIECGLYHYSPLRMEAELLQIGDVSRQLESYLAGQEAPAHAPLIIFLTAIFDRSKNKYGERGYRFSLLEAGHIAQNIILVSQALGLSSLPIGGFFDDDINSILGLDSLNEAAVYGVAIGR